jgi:uncharacterized protein (DUF305 family)
MLNQMLRSRGWLLAGVGVAVLGVAACSNDRKADEPAAAEATPADAPPAADAAAQASNASGPFMPIEMDMKQKMAAAVGPTPEHTWALKMIPHHQGGIAMSRALLNQSPNGPMSAMAQKTIDEQTKDTAELERWVQGHKAPAGGASNPFAEMEGAMSQKMMAAAGADADQTWARKMIEHHQGAIEMAKRVLQDAKDTEIRRMAQKTIDMQTKDIEKLRSMLSG